MRRYKGHTVTRLREGVDYEYDDLGRMVLTEQFHLRRGFCCGNGCIHCPFDGEKGSIKKRDEYTCPN